MLNKRLFFKQMFHISEQMLIPNVLKLGPYMLIRIFVLSFWITDDDIFDHLIYPWPWVQKGRNGPLKSSLMEISFIQYLPLWYYHVHWPYLCGDMI